MSKRQSPEEKVIAYFMSQPIVLAEQMLSTIRAIMRQRLTVTLPSTPKAPERRKRSRKPTAPKLDVTPPAQRAYAAAAPEEFAS